MQQERKKKKNEGAGSLREGLERGEEPPRAPPSLLLHLSFPSSRRFEMAGIPALKLHTGQLMPQLGLG
jgi:hypothetical protein